MPCLRHEKVICLSLIQSILQSLQQARSLWCGARHVLTKHGGRSRSGPDPKRGGGGGDPPLRTPKLSYGTMCFVGARGAGAFVLGIGQGEIFLFDPMCLYSKYSEFRGEFKNG